MEHVCIELQNLTGTEIRCVRSDDERRCSVYHGPSIYARHPVIRHTLVLGALGKSPPRRFAPAFLADLFGCLGGLREQHDSCGAPGVFEQGIQDAERFSINHLFEHVCIELQNLTGIEIRCVRSDGGHGIGIHEAVYPYEDEDVGLESARLALDLIHHLLPTELWSAESLPPAFDFTQRRDAFIVFAERHSLPVQDRALISAARARDIPVTRISGRLVQLGHGRFRQRFSGTKTSLTNVVSNDLAANKDRSRRILGDLGLPVPRHERVYSAREAANAAERIGYPVVVKPNNGKMGRGVSVGMRSAREVRAAYKRARNYGRSAIVEEFVRGDDYRLLVINGQLSAAAKRIPGHVVGDGVHTIEQLVEEANSDPRRGKGQQHAWTCLKFDEQAERLLAELGYTRQSIPHSDEIVYLRRNANTSDGGTAIDVTDDVHPDNRAIAVRAANAIGLDVAGVDFLTSDISRPMTEHGGCICEVNSRPGLRKHLWPAEGKPRDVTGPIIDMLFPPGSSSRIPIVAVTGLGSTTTTARMAAHILMLDGHNVGLATRDGVYINGRLACNAQMAGPAAARMILLDPAVDAAVLETTPRDVILHGLGYDSCDVCAVVNAGFGGSELDDSDSSEGLADAIRVVIGAARKAVVVRDDDECSRALADDSDATQCYLVTVNADHPPARDHIMAGRRSVVLEKAPDGEAISIYDHGSLLAQVPMNRLPELPNASADEALQSALFAAALAFSLGKHPDDIHRGLNTFNPLMTGVQPSGAAG